MEECSVYQLVNILFGFKTLLTARDHIGTCPRYCHLWALKKHGGESLCKMVND